MERSRHEDRETRRNRLLRGLLARDLVEETAAAFDAARVSYVALKGVVLHLTGCRSAAERALLDVDVLVPRGELGRAVRALETMGFGRLAESDAAVTLGRRSTPLPIDLHHRLFPPGFFDLRTESLLARAATHEGIRIPSPLDLYAHLVGHWVKGRLTRRDRAHIEDFASVARHFDLDAGVVARHLEAHGLGRAARGALGTACDHGDAFASEVIDSLLPDPIGARIARGARALLEASPPRSRRGVIAAHALNTSVAKGAGSLVRHAYGALRRSVT